MDRLRHATWLGLVVLGCGGNTNSDGAVGSTGGAETGGRATSAGGTGGGHAGGISGSAGASVGCHVGVRVDACCSEPIAVDSRAFEDPCVLPYRSYYTSEELAGCPASEACLMVECTHPAPPSRVATLRNGECGFDDECIMAAEPYSFCWVATDHNYCCSCPEVIPRVVVEADACVLDEGPPEPGTCADCSLVDCAPCDAPEPSIFCEYDSLTRLSVCRGRSD